MLYDESNIVIERVNGGIITEAQLIQMAIGSILSKGSRKQFSKTIKELNVSTKPHERLFD